MIRLSNIPPFWLISMHTLNDCYCNVHTHQLLLSQTLLNVLQFSKDWFYQMKGFCRLYIQPVMSGVPNRLQTHKQRWLTTITFKPCFRITCWLVIILYFFVLHLFHASLLYWQLMCCAIFSTFGPQSNYWYGEEDQWASSEISDIHGWDWCGICEWSTYYMIAFYIYSFTVFWFITKPNSNLFFFRDLSCCQWCCHMILEIIYINMQLR